jgi:hypothetical protein
LATLPRPVMFMGFSNRRWRNFKSFGLKVTQTREINGTKTFLEK